MLLIRIGSCVSIHASLEDVFATKLVLLMGHKRQWTWRQNCWLLRQAKSLLLWIIGDATEVSATDKYQLILKKGCPIYDCVHCILLGLIMCQYSHSTLFSSDRRICLKQGICLPKSPSPSPSCYHLRKVNFAVYFFKKLQQVDRLRWV
jgi:hypothetical protein